jgi:uncharacterized OB-fold protein
VITGPDDSFFWDGVARGELLLQHCNDCDALRHPPGPMCPRCGSLEWGTRAASGRGVLHSWVIPRHRTPPGFDAPYIVALIELEEGARLVSNLIGVDVDATAIRNDMAVEVCFVDGQEGQRLHAFRPVAS